MKSNFDTASSFRRDERIIELLSPASALQGVDDGQDYDADHTQTGQHDGHDVHQTQRRLLTADLHNGRHISPRVVHLTVPQRLLSSRSTRIVL
jgi:hypothetical protein